MSFVEKIKKIALEAKEELAKKHIEELKKEYYVQYSEIIHDIEQEAQQGNFEKKYNQGSKNYKQIYALFELIKNDGFFVEIYEKKSLYFGSYVSEYFLEISWK